MIKRVEVRVDRLVFLILAVVIAAMLVRTVKKIVAVHDCEIRHGGESSEECLP